MFPILVKKTEYSKQDDSFDIQTQQILILFMNTGRLPAQEFSKALRNLITDKFNIQKRWTKRWPIVGGNNTINYQYFANCCNLQNSVVKPQILTRLRIRNDRLIHRKQNDSTYELVQRDQEIPLFFTMGFNQYQIILVQK